MDGEAWAEYLAGFHAGHPGITEEVLGDALAGSEDPYGWLCRLVPAGGRVLDLACGSAPLRPYLIGRHYLGVDVSEAELAVARACGAGSLVRALAAALPVATQSVQVVVCSMSLQVLDPLPGVLAEVARVLVPGGLLLATVPDRAPLRAGDVPSLAGLLAALGGASAIRTTPHSGGCRICSSGWACGSISMSGVASGTGWAVRRTRIGTSPRCISSASPSGDTSSLAGGCGCWPVCTPGCPYPSAGSPPGAPTPMCEHDHRYGHGCLSS